MSRLDAGERFVEPDLEADYLLEYFIEIIECSKQATHTDILSWVQLKGVDLNAWEVETITKMIAAFFHYQHLSSDKQCVNPLLSEEELKKQAQESIKNKFRAFSHG